MFDEQANVDETTEDDRIHVADAAGEGMVITPDDLPHAKLVLLRDDAESEEVYEIRGQATIGRFDEAVGPIDVDLGPLAEGVYVSRRHALIRHDGESWLLSDLGSSNGTFVKGEADFERIDGEVEISDGDVIALGNVKFAFHAVSDPQVA